MSVALVEGREGLMIKSKATKNRISWGRVIKTKRNELDREDLEHLMTLLSEFDCVYKLNNADKEAINKAIDVVWRECETRRRKEGWQ